MFSIVERPTWFPAVTAKLGDTRGPVVDLECELPLGGHVYLNETEANELVAACRKGGMPLTVFAELAAKQDEIDQQGETIARLEAELAAALAAQVKVIPLSEFVEAIGAPEPAAA